MCYISIALFGQTSMAHKQLVHSISCEKMFYLYVYILKLADEFLQISQEDFLLLKASLGCCSIVKE